MQLRRQIGIYCNKRNIKTDKQKRSQFTLLFLFSKKFSKCFILLPEFYLIMWLMKSTKNFEKIANLKIGELVTF